MPVYSMTGYASAQHSTTATASESDAKAPGAQLGLEIRSVNSRFLDLSFRLPEDLRQFEPALRDLLVKRNHPGSLCPASIEIAAATAPNPPPNCYSASTRYRTASAGSHRRATERG